MSKWNKAGKARK